MIGSAVNRIPDACGKTIRCTTTAMPVAAETMIGVILQSQNQPKLAQKHFERAIALDPHAAVAANNLAWLYAQAGGNLDAALALAQSAREALPNRPEINDTLGWIYYRKGLPDLAIPPLEQSVEEQPTNAAYRYHLGLAYLKAEQKAKARRALEEALRLQPDFAGADDARSREGPEHGRASRLTARVVG